VRGGGSAPAPSALPRSISAKKKEQEAGAPAVVAWLPDAERELRKIPFFVRGKARRNTEAFAAERGLAEVSIDTLYEAKAHYAR
jgi:light-independent protochlorophyllide reductase subunit B